MGWADKVAGSDVTGGGVYFKNGNYPVLFIDKAIMKESRKGKELFIVEFKILVSEVEERPAGGSVSQVYNMTDHDAAPGNVKGFIGAAQNDSDFADAKLENMTDKEKKAFIEAIQMVVSDDNPLHGRLVRAEANTILTEAGNDFTLVKFSGIGDDIQQSADALLKEAGFAPF